MDNMTVCDKFQPSILEGQLCYTLDSSLLKQYSTKSSKSNGLLLLLDPSPYHFNYKDKGAVSPEVSNQNFKVFIHTLEQYTTFGPGLYGMSGLKKMTGTESFQQLPDHQKECLLHDREECQTQKYLEKVLKECTCRPWALHNGQVKTKQ